MKKYYLPLLLAILISGCLPEAKPISLNKKYTKFDSTQTACLKIMKNNVPFATEKNCDFIPKECKDFLTVLDEANHAFNLMQTNKDNPKFYRLNEKYKNANRHLLKQYKHLNLVIKGHALGAIDKDEREYFLELAYFPHHPMNLSYYKYMRKDIASLKSKSKYLKFERKYALKMYKEGYALVNKGQYTQGLSLLEVSADMKNIKAAQLCGDTFRYIYPQNAKGCYEKGANLGSGHMMLDLAREYEKEDLKKEALHWYERSAKAGNFISLYKLYTLDTTNHIESLRKSANKGYDKAQLTYGKYLSKKKDYKNAKKYLLLASNQGLVAAYYPLGKIYFAQSSYKKAYQYLSKGSENADSTYKLAYLKEHGKGTAKNYYVAATYYKKSKHLGKKGIQRDINRVLKSQKRLNKSHKYAQQRKAKESYEKINARARLTQNLKREDARIRSSWKAQAAESSRLKAQACGNEPTKSILNKNGSRIHLEGVLTHWLGKTSFIIRANGIEYLVRDELDKARLNKGDNVNMLAISTGKREITHGLTRSVFEEADEASIEKAYLLSYEGVCPY